MFGGFVFRKRFGLQFLRGRLGHHVEILVLAFGSTSGASRLFVCSQLAFVFQPNLRRIRALDQVLPPLPGEVVHSGLGTGTAIRWICLPAIVEILEYSTIVCKLRREKKKRIRTTTQKLCSEQMRVPPNSGLSTATGC